MIGLPFENLIKIIFEKELIMPIYKDGEKKTYTARFYYTDYTGDRKQKTKRGFKRATDAKAYERDFLNSLSQSANITFENLCANYMESEKSHIKPTSWQTKNYVLQKFLIPAFGKMKIKDITPLIIRRWETHIIKENDIWM